MTDQTPDLALSREREHALSRGRALQKLGVAFEGYHLYRLPAFFDRAEHGWDCRYVQRTWELAASQEPELQARLQAHLELLGEARG